MTYVHSLAADDSWTTPPILCHRRNKIHTCLSPIQHQRKSKGAFIVLQQPQGQCWFPVCEADSQVISHKPAVYPLAATVCQVCSYLPSFRSSPSLSSTGTNLYCLVNGGKVRRQCRQHCWGEL